MGTHFHIEAGSGHDALLAIVVHLNREDMGQAIDLLIDRLDLLSGDPDLEENGDDEGPGLFVCRVRDEALSQLPEHRDAALALASEDDEDDDPAEDAGDERDGCSAEDDFCLHNLGSDFPGCPVADGDCSTNSGAGDPAWAEWHTRGRYKVGKHGEEQCRTLGTPNMADEDAEVDDPIEANGDELDGIGSEEDFMRHEENGPGCPISDADEPTLGAREELSGDWKTGDVMRSDGEIEDDDIAARRPHRDRIRATRCTMYRSPWIGAEGAVFKLRGANDQVSA